ncbi:MULTISPECIES: type IV conjugative transfer system protein TraL [Cysteiniphilum]|uniref:type IV conjugative transfer system protein TraL n=1 Tax=Cysteiniphilum TaxID=2056696 RepID=UPI00177F02C8|nr:MULTISPECIES: type IV conjugative transfer system protein TraL [Cysteiniphilum]
MSTDNMDYGRVSKFLNKPKLVLGCTYDEAIPAMVVAVIGVLTANLAIMLIIAAGWIMGLKLIKRYRTPAYLMVCCYWFLGKSISKAVFPRTLDASKRFWLF